MKRGAVVVVWFITGPISRLHLSLHLELGVYRTKIQQHWHFNAIKNKLFESIWKLKWDIWYESSLAHNQRQRSSNIFRYDCWVLWIHTKSESGQTLLEMYTFLSCLIQCITSCNGMAFLLFDLSWVMYQTHWAVPNWIGVRNVLVKQARPASSASQKHQHHLNWHYRISNESLFSSELSWPPTGELLKFVWASFFPLGFSVYGDWSFPRNFHCLFNFTLAHSAFLCSWLAMTEWTCCA